MLQETVDVVLRGGATVHVRPVGTGDAEALAGFLAGMSAESRYLRFFSGGVDTKRVARRIVEDEGAFALVAEMGRGRAGAECRVVGIGELAELGDGRAEVAFTIADDLHGQGLGTVLLAHLAQHARAHGIERLVAHVMRANTRMANVFRGSGFAFAVRSSSDELVFEAPATLSPEGLVRFEERMRIATAASVSQVLRPASVGIVGPVDIPGSMASRVVAGVLAGGYTGRVRVLDVGEDVGEPVDLLVVAVAAEDALTVAARAAESGCGALLVLSRGFAEVGPDGAARQARLVDICRSAGMRLVGPNCLGVASTDPAVRLNATQGIVMPPAGNVALLTQSGALAISLLERASQLGLGLSSFVAVGNKADLSGNDLLQFWEEDERTGVVLLYLESFGNPRNFARIARRVSGVKPIVAVKSGRSAAGARATASHTGSLLAASDVTVDALFRQSGVVRADTLGELLDVGALLSRQPVPRGARVAVVTDAGGPGVLAADA
ncbi:MAG TPA: GNAT family N-acetyltransferase, partial [Solirubrobacteraceae bacterium]|nr:GNAT family N-acetyltransferase [Solirubrobacteraceae bacterium]